MARKRNTRESSGQKSWDWDRESRRAALRNAVLPTKASADGVLVPAARLWATLVVLEDHASSGNCFPGIETIAREARQSRRTTLRALEVLEECGLILRERRRPWNAAASDRRTLTHYAIVWGELAALQPKRVDLMSPDQSAVAPDQSAVAPDQSAVAPDQSAVAARPIRNTGTPYRNPDRNPVPPTPATATGGDQAADTGWGGVDRILFGLGIGIRQKLIREWKGAGKTPQQVDQDLREVVRLAAVDQGRFLLDQGVHDVGSAIVFRLRTGVWPVKIDQDLAGREERTVRRQEAERSKAWTRLLHQAWRSVRTRTVAGELVDDAAVVEEAVRLGVPRAWAAAERGVAVSAAGGTRPYANAGGG